MGFKEHEMVIFWYFLWDLMGIYGEYHNGDLMVC